MMKSHDGNEVGACRFRTLDGYEIDYDADAWLVPTPNGLERLAVSDLPGAGGEFCISARKFLALRLAEVRPGTVTSQLSTIRRMLFAGSAWAGEPVEQYGWGHFQAFERAQRVSGPSTVRAARQMLHAWTRLGVEGLSTELVERLGSIDDTYEPRPSPVRIRCPRRGPLTKAELAHAVSRLFVAAEQGTISQCSLVCCLTILTLGSRPAQVALLKVRDLLPPGSDGRRRLWVPSVKRQGEAPGIPHRKRPLSRRLGDSLAEQADRGRSWAAARGLDPENAPLIPRRANGLYDVTKRPELPGWEGHTTADSIIARFNRTMAALDLVSPRTGEPQRVKARRARYTLATVARASGATAREVSDMLDQKSSRNSAFYISGTREVMARVERAMQNDLRAIAEAFKRPSGNEQRKPGQ